MEKSELPKPQSLPGSQPLPESAPLPSVELEPGPELADVQPREEKDEWGATSPVHTGASFGMDEIFRRGEGSPERIKIDRITPYAGERDYFAAIAASGNGHPPVHSFHAAGVMFQFHTARPVPLDDDDDMWLALSPREPGGKTMPVSHERLLEALDAIRWMWCRWSGFDRDGIPRRCEVFSAKNRTVQKDEHGRFLALGYRQTIDAKDEPLSRYLVLIPSDRVPYYGGRDQVAAMPKLGELFPELEENPQSKHPITHAQYINQMPLLPAAVEAAGLRPPPNSAQYGAPAGTNPGSAPGSAPPSPSGPPGVASGQHQTV